MMYVIWKIKLEYKNCKIGFSSTGQSTDTCSDGRSLRNTSRSQSYLHIPNFTTDDVGVYKCESAYNGGNENYVINMAIAGRTLFFLYQSEMTVNNLIISKGHLLKKT